MKVGDLVRLNNVGGGYLGDLRGIVLRIDIDERLCQITWTDGDLTWEFERDLEAVSCK